ncbi:tetratricopeptide repeat protein [Zobellella aerophila]|uniref:GGDEF domain-containing protein n=1 Tax=Zobellella aerophila TaxID=870480 RepID=A0ABP6VLF7_9GAMM
MILSVAVLVSHLAGSPPLLEYQPEPAELQRARQLLISRPAECIALTNYFLQRDEADPEQLINSRQDRVYQDQGNTYRTREQTLAALQIQALCQANEGLMLPADASLDEAIELGKNARQPHSQAASLLLKTKLTLAQGKTDQAQLLLAQAEELVGQSKQDRELLAKQLQLLQAESLLEQHKFDEAKLAFEQIRLQAQQQGDLELQAWANYLLGDYYRLLQQAELALSHYVETLELLTEQHQYYLKALAAENAATLYAGLGNPQKAVFYANQATTEFELLGNGPLLVGSLISLGRVTRANDDANLALVYFFNAMDLVRIQGDAGLMSRLYYEVGQSYLNLKQFKDALHYLNLARARFQMQNDQPRLVDTLLLLGRLHQDQQEPGLAMLQLEKAQTLAEQLDDVPRLIESHRLLALGYEQNGNYRQALTHQQAFHNYYERASQLNRLLTQSLIQESDQQLQQERELAELHLQKDNLQQERQRFAMLAVGLSLISPLLLYGLMRNHIRCRRLQLKADGLQQSLLVEPRTGLSNWRQLMQRLPQEMAKRQQRSEQWYLNEAIAQPFNDKIYYFLIRVPFMADLNEKLGLDYALKIQQNLGDYLQGRIHPKARIYDLRDGQFIYVISQRQVPELQQAIASIERMFDEFPCPFELDRRLAIGIIGHPFLPKAPHAMDDMRLSDILYLAMAAAHQLSEQTGDATWVELLAVDCQQAAFFNGDIRHCCIQAIHKGLVKVNSSHQKQRIDWTSLVPDPIAS